MKIKQLRLKNFAKFEEFEIVFNDDITHLVGINGSGKTTVGLNAIWAGFKGIAEKSSSALIGERYRFISPGKKSLDIEITIQDDESEIAVVLKRHITKDVNQISIESADGLSKEYVENLLNVTFLSASHFTSLSGKNQALALGINTAEFDDFINEIKSDAQLIRKQLKSIGEISEVEKVEKVSVSNLIAKRDEILSHNQSQKELSKRQSDMDSCINELTDTIKLNEKNLKQLIADKAKIPNPVDLVDSDNIDDQIHNAERTNEQSVAYESMLSLIKNKQKVESELTKNIESQDIKTAERLEYIKSFSFGMKGLSVDETGSLLLNDKPIKLPYFSKGEIEMIVANISSGLNPDLKVRFIDDFESLDEDNQSKIIKGLTKRGFQIITSSVGDKKIRDNSVLLRECKIVN